jgi:hypothetical protein
MRLVGAVGIEPSSPLATRKLLIPRLDKSDKNDRNAQPWYAAGTRQELIPFPDGIFIKARRSISVLSVTGPPWERMTKSVQDRNSSAPRKGRFSISRGKTVMPANRHKTGFRAHGKGRRGSVRGGRRAARQGSREVFPNRP